MLTLRVLPYVRGSTMATVWKKEQFTLTEKKFRQSISLVKRLISRKFCERVVRVNVRNFHTVMARKSIFR